jgi:murein DD-endopeptidase MepM/ murein hydrolase activator NlpD
VRKYAPLAIIVAAFALYSARGFLFPPLKVAGEGRFGSRDPRQTSSLGGMDLRGFEEARPDFGRVKPSESENVVHGTISRGKPFFLEMQQAGVSPLDIHNIVQATREVFNFKKVQPGQKYSVYAGPDGGVDSLRFVVDHEKILNVSKIGDSYEARVDMVPYRIERFVTSAAIDQSIFLSLQRMGADPELAVRMAAIFQWNIDFFKDIHKGDTFSILYEKKIYETGRIQMGDVLAARIVSQGREHNAFRYRSKDGHANYYDEKGRSLQKSLLRAPLEYSRVSSGFSYNRKHPVTHHWKPHLGVDYAAPHGTPVRATGDGVVAAAAYDGSNGNYVKIRHNSRYETYYLHLSRFGKGIRKGARVSQGQVIGYVGATGLATGPHLDYRIKVAGSFVNPRTIELPSKEPVPQGELALFEQQKNAYLVGLLETPAENATVAVGKPASVKPSRLERSF